MSEYHFTDGNLIILYAIHESTSINGGIPDYINERIKVCADTYRIIMQSKPDKYKTMVVIITNKKSILNIKGNLVKAGVDEKIIAEDCVSENMAQTFDYILNIIKTKINPPYIYFVGSVWLRDIYDSMVFSKLKGYRVQFQGALDHRPLDEVEREKELNIPKKGTRYYKRKAKDKTIDILLNYIFREGK
jgi:hypothetical protein